MSERPRLLFYVQHLLGIGHLARASRIARACHEAGIDTHIISGGMPVDGFPGTDINLVQLPPLRTAPGDFSTLITDRGEVADDAYKARRLEMLLSSLDQIDPHFLIIEAFPFARRQMRFEILPFIEAAHARNPRPVIASSVRDIVQRSTKPGRAEETIARVRSLFDSVFVHGDPEFASLETAFPEAAKIRDITHYTGLVTGPAQKSTDQFDVVISAGGGAVGDALARVSAEARALSRYVDKRWLIITGPNADDDLVQDLSGLDGITVERFRSDFAGLLSNAELSVSQAGYNTVGDILRASCRSVLVPFATGGETEQTERAQRLAARGLCVWIEETGLTAANLADAIDRAPKRNSDIQIDIDGAQKTAALLLDRFQGTTQQ